MTAIHATALEAGLLHSMISTLRKAWHWAWLDVVCQYRRSVIGPLWETLNVLVIVGGLTLVSSAIFRVPALQLAGYIGIGMIIWSAIMTLVNEGTTLFVRNADLIKTRNIETTMYVGRLVCRVAILFLHHLTIYVLGLAVGILSFSVVSPLAVIGIIALFINGFWVVTVLAFLCARFRDLELIVRNLLQLVFFITPVFWEARLLAPEQRFLVDFNVVYHFMELIRAPLLGHAPPILAYVIVGITTLLGFLLAAFVRRRMRRDLAFFV